MIPHFGSRALTIACVDAIERATDGRQYELVVVDNGTGHDLPGRVVRNERNEGFASACNRGAAATNSDLLLFLNNDTEPQPGWLPPLLNAISVHRVAAVGSLLFGPDGRPERALPRLIRRQDGRLDTENLVFGGPQRDVRLLCAASLLVRRSVFSEVGGFDEGYWNGHEDIDLCLKMEAAGWRLRFVPESRVMHRVSQSGPERWAKLNLNLDRLHKRWRRNVQVDAAYPLTARALYYRGRRSLGLRRQTLFDLARPR